MEKIGRINLKGNRAIEWELGDNGVGSTNCDIRAKCVPLSLPKFRGLKFDFYRFREIDFGSEFISPDKLERILSNPNRPREHFACLGVSFNGVEFGEFKLDGKTVKRGISIENTYGGVLEEDFDGNLEDYGYDNDLSEVIDEDEPTTSLSLSMTDRSLNIPKFYGVDIKLVDKIVEETKNRDFEEDSKSGLVLPREKKIEMVRPDSLEGKITDPTNGNGITDASSSSQTHIRREITRPYNIKDKGLLPYKVLRLHGLKGERGKYMTTGHIKRLDAKMIYTGGKVTLIMNRQKCVIENYSPNDSSPDVSYLKSKNGRNVWIMRKPSQLWFLYPTTIETQLNVKSAGKLVNGLMQIQDFKDVPNVFDKFVRSAGACKSNVKYIFGAVDISNGKY